MTNYILCHKCSGVLAGPSDPRLHDCRCMSGWIRGFEPPLILEDAIAEQEQERQNVEQYRKFLLG